MRLVLLGYFGFGNTGDEAVLAAEVAALREALGPTVELVVVSGDPEHTRVVQGLPAVRRTDAAGIARELLRSDGLVAGGGSLLQDITSARPVSFYAGVMLLARALRKPVFVYAQGLGPLRRSANRWLAGRALRSASYVSLRDAASGALAVQLRIPEVDLVPDPVMGLAFPPETDCPGPARLAVALRPWDRSAEWLPTVTSALVQLSRDVEIVLVPFHRGQDVELARELAAELDTGLGRAALVVEPDEGYRSAVDAVAGAGAVFGMRLHALIVAAAAGRPFVALSYDPKVAAFAARAGQPVAATVPGPVDPEALVATVRKALEGPDEAYLGRLAELRLDARRPAREIARRLRVTTP